MNASNVETIIQQVATRLASMSTTTDRELLLSWQILRATHYVLDASDKNVVDNCLEALAAYIKDGVTPDVERQMREVTRAARHLRALGAGEVLPAISEAKRVAVDDALRALIQRHHSDGQFEEAYLDQIRTRLDKQPPNPLIAGVRHRFGLVADIATDQTRSESERAIAGAAIRYVDQVHDIVPDHLGVVGLLDDDYALRDALNSTGAKPNSEILHWSEEVAALWEDLPFLRGVNLIQGGRPVPTTWIDRIASYHTYQHAFADTRDALILLQPLISNTPVHNILTLMGLLVFECLTSAEDTADNLVVGDHYKVDGKLRVRFDGFARTDPRWDGWLRLYLQHELVDHQPRSFASRLTPCESGKLCTNKAFFGHVSKDGGDPIQKFFDWEAEIGVASIDRHIVLVTSRERAQKYFGDASSNGVGLLDEGLVAFLSTTEDHPSTSALVLIAPTLGTVRSLLEQGVKIDSLVFDGYRRLRRARDELRFVVLRQDAPKVYVWAHAAYWPDTPPPWLPENRTLCLNSADLERVLEVESPGEHGDGVLYRSIRLASEGPVYRPISVEIPSFESALRTEISRYMDSVSGTDGLPEFWAHHLRYLARTALLLVSATPARWQDVTAYASAWREALNDKWDALRTRERDAGAELRRCEARIYEQIQSVTDDFNAFGTALIGLSQDAGTLDQPTIVVNSRKDQTKIVQSLLDFTQLANVSTSSVDQLGLCASCITVGWTARPFASQILAHAPAELTSLGQTDEHGRWQQLLDSNGSPYPSMLTSIKGQARGEVRPRKPTAVSRQSTEPAPIHVTRDIPTFSEQDNDAECMFLFPTDTGACKVLPLGIRVIVEHADKVRETQSGALEAGDRVILGHSVEKWSPAEEFTQALVEAVQARRPELVQHAMEWRRALGRYQTAKGLTTAQLCGQLRSVGIQREEQTVEGWLRLERSEPIGPQHIDQEIRALWQMVDSDISAPEVSEACSELRSLHRAAGRAIIRAWAGRPLTIDIDSSLLDEVVARLRSSVEVHELESVRHGSVPNAMLGLWVPAGFITNYVIDT